MNAIHAAAGYKTYTGHIMTQPEADAYNRYTNEIERERWPETKEFLKDQRHKFLVIISEGTP